MTQTLRTTSPTCGARSLALRLTFTLAIAFVASLAFAPTALAQSTGQGPGVNSLARIEDGKLRFELSSSVPGPHFSGEVTLSATRGAVEWTPFDRPATVGADGGTLVQSGSVGGVPIDEYFAAGEQRRIRMRNGDGTVSELDVVRSDTFLFVGTTNRTPGARIALSEPSSGSRTFDATPDASVSVEIKPGTVYSQGTDVVVAAMLAPAPDGATQYPQLAAIDTTTSAQHYGTTSFGGGGTVAFYHFVLPDGTYRINGVDSLGYGNPISSSSTTLFVDLGDIATLDVSSHDRLFAISLPAPAPPPLVDVTLTLGGLEGFEPAFSDRIDLNVLLATSDGRFNASAIRDVGDPGPVVMTFHIPAGTYHASATVFRTSDSANGTGFYENIPIDTFEAANEVAISIPPLVKLTGTVFDPGLTLAGASPNGSGIAQHYVTASGDGGFSALASLSGFARGYKLFVPRGAEIRVGANLIASLGKPFARYSAAKNDTGTIRIVPDTHTVTCADGGCDLDLTVPELAKYETVTGTVVDENGRAVPHVSVEALFVSLGGDEATSFSASVIANSRGEFRLRVPRGSGYRIYAVGYFQ